MSDIGGLVDELIAAGTPPGMAAQIVARAFAAGVSSAEFRGHSADVSADKRRERDRIRKQLKRGIPQNSADVRGNPQNSEIASSLKEERLENKDLKKDAPQRSVRGSRMLPDWKPDPDEWQATVELIGGQRAQAELLKFRDYWIALPSAKGLKADWPATWRNWIRRITESTGATNGNRPHDQARRSSSADFFAGIASVAADIAGNDQSPRDAPEEIPLGRFNING